MTGGQAIAEILRREGVELLFTYPDNPVIDPIAAAGIRPLMGRSERSVVAMADGFSRVSNGRRLGVVAVQFGPGIESAFGGIAQAHSDSTPILVLCGHPGLSRLGQPPTFSAAETLRPVTKLSLLATSADRLPGLLRRAFTALRSGRPGPVLLEIPEEFVAAGLDEALVTGYRPVRGARAMSDPAALPGAVETLLAAEQLLIHAGQGVLYAEATAELVELAELLDAPVMTTLPGKSGFPETHPLSLGAGGVAGPRAAADFLERADVVLGIGASMTSTVFAAPVPPGKRLVQATVDDRDLNKDYPAEHLLLGDARLVLRQLAEEARGQLGAAAGGGAGGGARDTGVRAAIAAIHAEEQALWLPHLTSAETPISPYRVIGELIAGTDPAQTIVTHDSGRPRDQLAPMWRATVPRGYLGWGKSTHLGYGHGLAMGAKLAAPDKLVVNVMGDAAFGFVGMEVETASRLGIGILTIVFNNSAMSNYGGRYPETWQRHADFGRMEGDYANVARSLGAWAERVERPEDLAATIALAIAATRQGQPALLDIVTKQEPALSKHW